MQLVRRCVYGDRARGIDIGGLSSTLIGCDPRIAAAGAAFTSALDRAATYEVDDDVLTLHDDDGAQLAWLRSDVGAPLEGVTWPVFAYRDGPIDDKQTVVPVVGGSTITLEFDGAETLSGSSGCNTHTTN
jgi:heat shock protein HslJ